jgi:dienelactone hydrolase
MVSGSSPEAGRIAGALGRAARMLPDARAERIAVFGHSRGGGAVLSHLLSGSVFQAAVLNSTGYPIEFASRVAPVDTPILMLHGTADSPANGGGPNSKIDNARAFEAARRAAPGLRNSARLVKTTEFYWNRRYLQK